MQEISKIKKEVTKIDRNGLTHVIDKQVTETDSDMIRHRKQ